MNLSSTRWFACTAFVLLLGCKSSDAPTTPTATPAPTITSVTPAQGQVGLPVVIAGTNLGTTGTTLALNGLSIPTFTNTTSQISFNVPVGAASGNLVVTTPNGSASHAFTVTLPTTSFDLQISHVQLTQSSQTLANDVPIVAGKDGLIRVFVVATPNQANTAAPEVRITLLNNNVVVSGYPKVVPAPAASVPTAENEGSLTSTWNLKVPGTDLTTPKGTGYSILAEVDPTGAVAESDKTNNTFTASLTGTTVPTFKTTIFPVVLSTGTGNITPVNKDQWVARLVKMFPVASVDVQIGSAFKGTIQTLSADDVDNSWDNLLNELATKHAADGASDRYYYGAVKVNYTSGVAGLGYAPLTKVGDLLSFQDRTAMGWDITGYQPDGVNAPEVFAHETGHNMGRKHSPCPAGANAPKSVDTAYPYPDASIGIYGYDSVLNVLHSPLTDKDIMAYCSPNWVSDYTYKGILTYRTASGSFLTVTAEDATLPAPLSVPRECLIVRGMVHDDGRVEMLPSFRTQALPTALPSQGEFTLECQNAKDLTTFSTPLELMELGCAPGEHMRHFVMALPLEPAVLNSLAGLRVHQSGQTRASLRSRSGMAGSARVVSFAPEAKQMADDQVRFTWDAAVHRATMVRDADTGEVIAILTGGQQTITATGKRFDLIFSDGVTGATQRMEPRP